MKLQGGEPRIKYARVIYPRFMRKKGGTKKSFVCPICGHHDNFFSGACPNCGAVAHPTDESPNDKNKIIHNLTIGLLLGFFFGLIGVLLCSIIGTKRVRKNSWSGFFISLPFVIVISFLLYVVYKT